MKEYNTGLGTTKFTQPVLVQKLATDFEMGFGTGTTLKTPAIAGKVLTQGDGNSPLSKRQSQEVLTWYCYCDVLNAMVTT